MEKTYNVCENRGNKRVWIEGKVLLDMQANRGIKFRRTMICNSIPFKRLGLPSDHYMVLTIGDESGKHTVAGTPERPIIDLNGKYLNEFFGDAPKYTAVFLPAIENEHATITITPIREESAK